MSTTIVIDGDSIKVNGNEVGKAIAPPIIPATPVPIPQLAQPAQPTIPLPLIVPHHKPSSVIDEMMQRRPTALTWHYGNRAELIQAIVDKNFKIRTVLLHRDSTQEVLVAGPDPNVTPVLYVEMSDGSCIYSTYLDAVNSQGNGQRNEPLKVYAFDAEAINDFRAIGLDQVVRLGGVKVWPENDAGFGPGYDYVKQANGTWAMVTSGSTQVDPTDDIPITDL